MFLQLDRHGWLAPAPGVRLLPSPNCDARPAGLPVSLLVIHNISLPPGEFGGPHVAGLFLNRLDYGAHPWLERLRGLRVSAHFFVRRDGAIVQFVSTEARAWHAGVSRFRAREPARAFAPRIALGRPDPLPCSDAQYRALAELARALRARYPLRAAWGHQHIAPGRKPDPGPAFS